MPTHLQMMEIVMRSSRLGTAVVLGLAASALIAGCSRKEPEQAAAPAAADAAARGRYCQRRIPDARVLRRHAPAHRHVDGRRRIRQPPRRRGRLPLRPRRGGDGLQRTEGEAVAPARFPGGRRPLRQHGILPGPVRRETGTAGRSHRQEMVRHDQGRRGQRGGAGHHRQVLARHLSRGVDVFPRHARPTPRRGS